MSATEGELKVKRRTAKGKFTRSVNALKELLDNNRSIKEVEESYHELKKVYEDVQAKHDAYCEALDDEAFEAEEVWIQNCMKTFMQMKMKVVDYADGSETDESPRPATSSVTSCKVQVEKPKLPRFSGDIREYQTFKSDFKHLIESRYEKRDCITILRTSLQGKPLDLIRGIGTDYDAAWEQLDIIYGDARNIADAVINDITKFKNLKDGEDTRFIELAGLVRRSYSTLKEVGKEEDMNNSHMLALIERKLTNEDRKIWLRQQSSPSLKCLMEWMSQELKTRIRASAPIRDGRSEGRSSHGASVHHMARENKGNETRKQDFKCWLCKCNDHWIDKCQKILQMNQRERYELMKENRACFSCLKRAGKDHRMTTCRRRKKCDRCSSFHHPLLHSTSLETPATESKDSTVDIASIGSSETLLPIVSVKVHGPRGAVIGNCLLDSGSQVTLIRRELAERLHLVGDPIQIVITKIGGETETVNSARYRLKLESLDNHRVVAIQAIGLDVINDNIATVEVRELARIFGLDTLNRGDGSIDLLIGVDHAKLHLGDGKTRQKGHLVARQTQLGWVVFGGKPGQSGTKVMNVQVVGNPIDLQDFWTTESMGVACPAREIAEQKEITDNCQKIGQQWLVPYPWRKDPKALQDNKVVVEKMLCATEKRLMKNEEHAKAYDQQIQEMVQMGFARKLSDHEMESYSGPVHYIPHHAVLRPDKKSTPIRIVFNSSSVYAGQSLNDFWMKGPDLLNNLFGVILRFRQKPVAVCADISKMYHRVLIPESDQHVHRFLWRDLQPDRKPDVYVMQVVTFGDKPAPAMAQTALRLTAEEGRTHSPEAAEVLKRDTYMDDICTSTDTREEAKTMTHDIDKILANGGFKVKGWTSNTQSRETEGDDTEKTLMENLAEEKVLGVYWDRKKDEFSYRVKIDSFLERNLTKRIILSQVARIFDPIGYTAPFVIRAKIGLQKLWEAGYSWDAVLPEECQDEWKRFFREMEELKLVTFDRCLTPNDVVGKPLLCVFSDASMDAFGACAYLRWETKDGDHKTRFVAAKSRVAPLKPLTVPRLELQAAVLASRLYKTILEELTIEIDDVIFMTDSMISLSWIRNRARTFKTFVATRVGEIQSNTDPSKWRHISGEDNIADVLSRGLKASELNGSWENGPDFLRQQRQQWPEEVKVESSSPDADFEKERRRETMVLAASQSCDVVDYKRFSSWRKLVRVTALVLKFVKKLKANLRNKAKETNEGLTPTEIEEGEMYIIKSVQKSLKARIEKGELKSLSPFIDDNGVIRVGGRIDRAIASFEQKHPVLLPYGHPVSMLITRHVHENGHSGVAATMAKIRLKYWILRGHKLAKTVKYRCTRCRVFQHKTEIQEMAELPKERLALNTPPFHFTSCDYFGPLSVRVGRNKTAKYYGVIFTCLNTRAVHLELAVDCSTMEFLQVLRRFFSIRGQPAMILSDNGTQFVGAERELRKMTEGLSTDELKEFCAEKGTRWKFVTPGAPHQNGCAESLVKSCKHALRKAIGEQVLTPFELYTCLLEVGNLVNQRPIGRIPTDPDDGSYISPNDMILGRASGNVAQGPFLETRNPRHRVELVQRIVDSFWQRWTRDVLPLLTPRRKWNVDRRNVRVDDIVMLVDTNAVRSKWTIARVVEVYPGEDGKVRNVKVKTMNSEYRRPVTKVAVIYPAEGYED